MLSHALLRMHCTQLLSHELPLAKNDLLDACSQQTLALVHLGNGG